VSGAKRPLSGGEKVVFLSVGQVRSSGWLAGADLLQAESDETPLSCVANEGKDNRRDDDHEGENYQESEIHFVHLLLLLLRFRVRLLARRGRTA
jgi:hypothetical protein